MTPERSIFSDTSPPFGPRPLRETIHDRLERWFGPQALKLPWIRCPHCDELTRRKPLTCGWCFERIDGEPV